MSEHWNKYRKLATNSTTFFVVLMLITLAITLRYINIGDFRHPDAWSHAMNGVFIMDFIKEAPLTDPITFALQYYGKYPAISMPYHPLFFPLIESVFFSIFGVTAFAARLTVVFFSLIAIGVWYKLVESTYSKEVAFFSGFLLVTTPTVVLYSRETMLEMPALAMIMLSVYFFHLSVDLNKKRYIYYCAFCIGLSLWTKQTTIFIIPVFLSYIIVKKGVKYFFKSEPIIAGLILMVFIVPLAIITFKFASYAVEQAVVDTKTYYDYSKDSAANWLYYIQNLPNVITLKLLLIGLISFIWMIVSRRHVKKLFFLLWLIWVYAIISYISVKSVRYAYFAIPPFCVFAALTYDCVKFEIHGIRLSMIILVVLCLFQLKESLLQKPPFIIGAEEAAEYVIDHPKGNAVMVCSFSNGNFIFNIRKNDINKTIITLRGDKVLPDQKNDKSIFLNGYKRKDIYPILRKYGIKYIVVGSREDRIIPQIKRIKNVLSSNDFDLVKVIHFNTNNINFVGHFLAIYEFKENVSRQEEALEIFIPKMGRTLKLPVSKVN